MAIKPSAALEIRSLITSLAADDEITREAAIARLAVIGARATARLLSAYDAPSLDHTTRIAMLRALEGIADPRAAAAARRGLTLGPDVALAAIGVLRALLVSNHAAGTEALDALVATVVDQRADRSVRLAAFTALRTMPEDVQGQLRTALREDPDPVLRACVEGANGDGSAPDLEWEEALAGRVGTDPDVLLDVARRKASSAPLGPLGRLIDAARAREAEGGPRRTHWQALRAYLHLALALRDSRVALPDLRDSFESAADPLPSGFVEAVHAVGDATCLEGLASAYSRVQDGRWRTRLRGAVQAITGREKLSTDHADVRRIATRWPDAHEAFSTLWRTTPRRKTRPRT